MTDYSDEKELGRAYDEIHDREDDLFDDLKTNPVITGKELIISHRES